MKSILKYLIACLLSPTIMLSAQSSTDSLTLSVALQNVIHTHPALKKIEKDLTGADAKIALTKTAYLPDVNLTGSVSLLGPTTSISMPGLGAFQLFPPLNYSAAITINQTIYDFGKTDQSISTDNAQKELLNLSVEQVKQKLSAVVVSYFYSICYLQKAIILKEEQLKNLNEHVSSVEKKAVSGSATKFDILTTQVRISVVENQLTDLKAALTTQTSQLNSLMGKTPENALVVKTELLHETMPLLSSNSSYEQAYTNRSEVKLALQKEALTRSKLGQINTQQNPLLYAYASGGFKNGYFNTHFEDTGKPNYLIGVGIKVPLFDANRTKYMKLMTNADLESNKQETAQTKLNISQEVVLCRTNTEATWKKLTLSELHLQQATKAYELAQVNYQAGTITNLELLDSYTALSDSKLAKFKTQIDYSLSLQSLKIALGEKLL